jgi:hypothetical protein
MHWSNLRQENLACFYIGDYMPKLRANGKAIKLKVGSILCFMNNWPVKAGWSNTWDHPNDDVKVFRLTY